MIAVRIKAKSEMASAAPVMIRDVAYVMCDARIDAGALTIPMPRDTGIWLVDAGSILSAIYKKYPSETVRLLGDSIGWLRRLPERTVSAHGREWLRQACASVFGRIHAKEPQLTILPDALLEGMESVPTPVASRKLDHRVPDALRQE